MVISQTSDCKLKLLSDFTAFSPSSAFICFSSFYLTVLRCTVVELTSHFNVFIPFNCLHHCIFYFWCSWSEFVLLRVCRLGLYVTAVWAILPLIHVSMYVLALTVISI